MKALTISLAISFIFSAFSFAQFKPNQVLLSINNRNVTAGEFEKVYLKNSQVGTAEKETVDSYFDLFVKFKLKVTAAIDSGLDTLPSFKNEFKGYRDQLAKNYLTNNEILEKLVKEAYFRTTVGINVSHIMITLPQNPSPADTLAAWNKIIKIQDRLKKGESFEDLALEVSEDPSAKSNKGLLGYFPCLRFPYTFESAAYNTPVGSVSAPVRTRYGYHLIKVNSKRNSPGEVKVAHIMVASPENSTDEQKQKAKEKIMDIYAKIQQGESFDTLARKFSDDQNSARNNGELSWFGLGTMMVPEFEETSFSLVNKGDISKPVKTLYGWHIIKLIDSKPVQEFEKARNDLKTKIAQNDRNELVQINYINHLKALYKPVTNKKAIEGLYKLDSLLFKNETNLEQTCDTSATYLTIQKAKYSVGKFISWIRTKRDGYNAWTAKDFIDKTTEDFISENIFKYENSQLENKNTEFADLVKEYYEGILLFDIMERNVWSKASTDSIGLESYFAKNKDKYSTPEAKPLDEIRGIVMSDYQNYLEENWLNDLRKKYTVTIDNKLLAKIANKYKNK
jgi:peptidyl-prolyl cis-trans isomerase SurA